MICLQHPCMGSSSVLLYAFLYVVHEGVALSALLDDRTPGVIGLQKDLKLEPGWFRKRYVDLADHQWKYLRDYALGFGLAAVLFVTASRAVACHAPSYRLHFYALSGTLCTGLLHGSRSGYLLTVIVVNYFVAKAAGGKPCGFGLIATINGTILLFIALLCHHEHDRTNAWGLLSALGTWQGAAGFIAARSLSFFTHLNGTSAQPAKAVQADGSLREGPREEDGKFLSFAAYVLYPPLFAAGPMVSFSEFQAQRSRTTPTSFFRLHGHQLLRRAWYGARLAGLVLLLEIVSHVLYFTALARTGMWRTLHESAGIRFSDDDVLLTAFWVAAVTWLKFQIIWKAARLVAVLDGVEAPENLGRCPFNILTWQELWQNWNASVNTGMAQMVAANMESAWQGTKHAVTILAAVLWYFSEGSRLPDLALIAIFALPQLVCRHVLDRGIITDRMQSKWYFRHLCAAAYALNHLLFVFLITGMYVTGPSGVPHVCGQLLKRPGELGSLLVFFFSMAHVSMGIRAKESELGHRLLPLNLD
eukprot:jgi/Botrbrau1/10004/Bobra.0012s0093.2